MYNEEQKPIKPHRLVMQNRTSIEVTGVLNVISYDPAEIVLDTSAGLLMIKGANLHMNHLSLEKGESGIDGNIDSMVYSNAQHGNKKDGHLFGRIFS